MEHLILRDLDIADLNLISVYEQHGGYQSLRKAVKEMTPDAVVDTVKKSGLRGRGGAGFPAGVKWTFLPKERTVTYLCVNFDESEPGTFNNRYLVEHDPHMLLEGILIAGFATQATTAYIYIRVEFHEAFHILQK